ncbi:unnamed protein product [Arctogadus glacialis]
MEYTHMSDPCPGRRALQDLSDVVLREGSATELVGRTRVSASPDPFIVWTKNGQQMKEGPKDHYVFQDQDVVALVVWEWLAGQSLESLS